MMHTRTAPPKHLSSVLVSLLSVRAFVWFVPVSHFLHHLPTFLCPVSPPPFSHDRASIFSRICWQATRPFKEGGEIVTLTLQPTYPGPIPPQNRSMAAAEAERYMHVCDDNFSPRNATDRELILQVREWGGRELGGVLGV